MEEAELRIVQKKVTGFAGGKTQSKRLTALLARARRPWPPRGAERRCLTFITPLCRARFWTDARRFAGSTADKAAVFSEL